MPHDPVASILATVHSFADARMALNGISTQKPMRVEKLIGWQRPERG